MKRKLLAIVALIAVVFVAAVLWRVDSFVFGDRMNWAEAQARSQMVSIHHALQIELKSLERIVYSFSSENFRKDKINWNSLQPYYAVASLNLSAQGDPQIQNLFVKEKSVAFNWNADFLSKAIGRITTKTTSGGTQVYVKPFQGGNNKERHVALVFVNGAKAYALVGAGEIFQSLIDAQKGSLNSFSIVNVAGLTVGHGVPEYVGTLLGEDPVFKVATQSGVTQGVGVFDSSDGQKIFGLYNQVPNSNLIILSSAPVKEIMKGRAGLLWQFFFLGIGLVLVGVAGILLAVRPHEKSLEQLRLHAVALLAGKKDFHSGPMTAEVAEIDGLLSSLQVGAVAAHSTATTPPTAVPKMGTPANSASGASVTPLRASPESLEKTQREKMEAYRRVASALGHEMRAPLSSILGYSQLVLSRSQDPEIVASIDSILRESRAARTILEKLFSFAGEQELAKSEMKVSTALSRALSQSQTLFSQKGVKVEKEISETSTLPISADELVKAFENIFTNAVEAMERMPQKNLTVRLFENTEGIHLQINDTGEGIEPQNLPQIFDPFFTTRSFQHHVGLGLAVVVGILKEHGANVQVHSVRGQGTQFNILFTKKSEQLISAVGDGQLAVSERLTEPATESVMPTPPTAPPSALVEAQEKTMAELKNIKDETVVGSPPVDVNIESLLELPPAASASASRPPPTRPPPAVPPSGLTSEQEFTFIDGFLGGHPKDAPSSADSASEATVVLDSATIEGLGHGASVPPPPDLAQLANAPVDVEVPKNNITAPKVPPPPPKTSRLDTYQVDIRKPGKR